MKGWAYIMIVCLFLCAACSQTKKETSMQSYVYIPYEGDSRIRTLPFDSLVASDPFILADKTERLYYLVSSGGSMWKSRDLEQWTGPYAYLKVDTTSWIGRHPWIWAPQLHQYNGKYYCFVTFTNPDVIVDTVPDRYKVQRRAVQILASERAEGPYILLDSQSYFPTEWSTLDGTFWMEDGIPYMVFGHGWMQTVDGKICCLQLSPDLSRSVSETRLLFRASEAPWSADMADIGELTFGMMLDGHAADGPFLFRTKTGRLGMLWSGWGKKRCAQGVAYSASGKLEGPWIQSEHPLVADDSGHAMLFRTFEGKPLMLLHHQSLDEENPGPRRPLLLEVDISGDELKILRRYVPADAR